MQAFVQLYLKIVEQILFFFENQCFNTNNQYFAENTIATLLN